jgi:hypothetical protein
MNSPETINRMKQKSMTKKMVFPAVCAVLLAISALPGLAQTKIQITDNAIVNYPIQADVSAPLRSYPVHPISGSSRIHVPLKPKAQQLQVAGASAGPVAEFGLQSSVGKFAASFGLSFEGLSGDPNSPVSENCPLASGLQVGPPDTNAAVGDTQIVQWVNLCYAVYDKATGNLISGPYAGNQFWWGFGAGCSAHNDGDPIIQFDKTNHVWVASQNIFGPLFGTCIAVSQTNDATGVYNRYFFPQPGFPDYHKFGLTPHAYYQTQNDFGQAGVFVGVNVCAYDADALRAGSKRAKQICVLDNSNGSRFDDSLLPADSDQEPPTRGSGSPAPEILLGSIDNALTGTNVYEYVFDVSFKGKGKATLTGVNGSMPVRIPQYALGLCSGFFGQIISECVPQPGIGSDLLDTLGDRLMYRLARFDDGAKQHFLVTHTVKNSTAMAVRWYEFTAPSGSTTLTLAQSGETPDDGEYRWVGSVARDKFGDIALGYSRSSANAGDFPSIYVSGQTAGEARGTTDAEVLAWPGNGSQFASYSRWGDYSSMALDGADGCSFWYTTEYYPFDGVFQWYTHLVQVKFPGCP